MRLEINACVEKMRRLKEEFGIDQKRLADHVEPAWATVMVSQHLITTDERYLTQTRTAAVEKGVGNFLNEYCKKLYK